MSHAYDCAAQIHVCGSPISKAAALQIEAAIPNFIIHEHHQRAEPRHAGDLPVRLSACERQVQGPTARPGSGADPETIKKCEIVTVTTRLPYMG